jgi:hypothetical protein
MPFRSQSLRLLDIWLVAILGVASFAVILRVGLLPRNPDAGVAIVYPPWTAAAQAIDRAVSAGARFVRFGGFEFIVVVVPDAPGYLDRVLSGSALLAIDPQILAACLPAALADKAGIP